MLLNASTINGAVLNGGVGDYQILIGSMVTNATTSTVPVLLIKPFSSSVGISALATAYTSVNWVLAANINITATKYGVLYKTSVLDGIDGNVTTTVYGSISKTDLLQSSVDVVAISSEPILSRYTWFESGVSATSTVIAQLLKVDTLSKSIQITANSTGQLNKTDWLSGSITSGSTLYNSFFKVIKNIAASTLVDSSYESILSLIVNMDSDVLCTTVVESTLDITKNMLATSTVLAIISNSHLKHLYSFAGLNIDVGLNNIIVSDTLVDYITTG